jgi:hypothetical protein
MDDRDILRGQGIELCPGLDDEDDSVYEIDAVKELAFDDEDSDDRSRVRNAR